MPYMILNVIKYCSFFYIIIFPLTMTANNINIPSNEVLEMPLPLPYNGEIYSENDVEEFLNKTIKQSKQPIIIWRKLVSRLQNTGWNPSTSNHKKIYGSIL